MRSRDQAKKELQIYTLHEAGEAWRQFFGERLPTGARREIRDMLADGATRPEVCYAIWRASIQEPKPRQTRWELCRTIVYHTMSLRIDWKGAVL